MRKEQQGATESVPKPKFTLKRLLIAYICFTVLIAFWIVIKNLQGIPTAELITPTSKISIEIADNSKTRQKGLSGRSPIYEKYGMLFVFKNSSLNNCFWMKDMNFAIDMIWMDEQKKVINIKQNVGPDTYPNTFCPETPAKYGLEIKANTAGSVGIVTGAELRF
jgi:uncharacterized membrane protein (UPF0127 family)